MISAELAAGALPNLQSGQIQGNGVTTFIAPQNQANAWPLTGTNQGSVDAFAFQGVQNLTGGNQADNFTYESGASLVTGTISEPVGGSVALTGNTIAIPGTLTAQGGSITVTGGIVGNNNFSVSGSIFTQGGNLNVYTAGAFGNSFTLSGSIYTQGGDLNVNADTIALDTHAGPATISTRDVLLANSSVGNSGNISLDGINITLGSNTGFEGTATLDSHVEAGSLFTAGTIDLTVSELAGAGTGGGFNFPVLPKLDSTQTNITLNTADVTGGDVTFTAMASSLHANSAPPDSGAAATIIQTGINDLQNFSIIGGLAESSSQTAIDLSADSWIAASSFTAMATATSDAETKPTSIKLGVAIAIVQHQTADG